MSCFLEYCSLLIFFLGTLVKQKLSELYSVCIRIFLLCCPLIELRQKMRISRPFKVLYHLKFGYNKCFARNNYSRTILVIEIPNFYNTTYKKKLYQCNSELTFMITLFKNVYKLMKNPKKKTVCLSIDKYNYIYFTYKITILLSKSLRHFGISTINTERGNTSLNSF